MLSQILLIKILFVDYIADDLFTNESRLDEYILPPILNLILICQKN